MFAKYRNLNEGASTMRRKQSVRIYRILSYFLVAILSAVIALACTKNNQTIYSYISNGSVAPGATDPDKKLSELADVLDTYFVGEVDPEKTAEAVAEAMVNALGDRWSYYMSADDYADYLEQINNAYVGIGVTISTEEDSFFQIQKVEAGSGADEAGLLPGDVIVGVEGESVQTIGYEKAKNMIKGAENTQVSLTILRDGAEHVVSVTRKTVLVAVATAQMLDNNIGLITITNFDERCAAETIAAIEELVGQGAEGLIFDVRYNPGGYKNELIDILDYLLPEGELFRSVDYKGQSSVDTSDAACLDIPMAVLINQDSYSAAEFFAAALAEYDWAVTVGEKTVGKGHFQNTFKLSDGSAVALSVGKYYTPKGVSLSEAGGLEPRIKVELDKETAAKVYAGLVEPKDDPQIQAAVAALMEEIG